MVPATTCLVLCLASANWVDIQTDYYTAYGEAEEKEQMLLLDVATDFEFAKIAEEKLAGYVLCRIPLDFTIEKDGETKRLIDFPAFQYLQGKPGLVIIDLRNKKTHRRTVSVLPQRHLSQQKVETLLTLPAGTLTQRTLLWAFRVHPERPAGLFSKADQTLMNHAANHSQTQAHYNMMHHANYFPGSFEIVAGSWSNQNIVEAAIELVGLWRSSPPHWWAASSSWSKFGCDMKSNGQQWYGTGVFE